MVVFQPLLAMSPVSVQKVVCETRFCVPCSTVTRYHLVDQLTSLENSKAPPFEHSTKASAIRSCDICNPSFKVGLSFSTQKVGLVGHMCDVCVFWGTTYLGVLGGLFLYGGPGLQVLSILHPSHQATRGCGRVEGLSYAHSVYGMFGDLAVAQLRETTCCCVGTRTTLRTYAVDRHMIRYTMKVHHPIDPHDYPIA